MSVKFAIKPRLSFIYQPLLSNLLVATKKKQLHLANIFMPPCCFSRLSVSTVLMHHPHTIPSHPTHPPIHHINNNNDNDNNNSNNKNNINNNNNNDHNLISPGGTRVENSFISMGCNRCLSFLADLIEL